MSLDRKPARQTNRVLPCAGAHNNNDLLTGILHWRAVDERLATVKALRPSGGDSSSSRLMKYAKRMSTNGSGGQPTSRRPLNRVCKLQEPLTRHGSGIAEHDLGAASSDAAFIIPDHLFIPSSQCIFQHGPPPSRIEQKLSELCYGTILYIPCPTPSASYSQ
jgi:hypothetical protein